MTLSFWIAEIREGRTAFSNQVSIGHPLDNQYADFMRGGFEEDLDAIVRKIAEAYYVGMAPSRLWRR
jgi:hypothetical protein